MSQNKVMNKIVFATNNAHKLEELRAIAGGKLEVVSPKSGRLRIRTFA